MNDAEILNLFLEKIPSKYPEHMLCYFANNALHGRQLPFTSALLRTLSCTEAACPGYAQEMLTRMGSIKGTGEPQYSSPKWVVGGGGGGGGGAAPPAATGRAAKKKE